MRTLSSLFFRKNALLAFLFFCGTTLMFSQNVSITKVEGNEVSSSLSASQRIQGAKLINLFVPSNSDEINEWIFRNFERYLTGLGLDVRIRKVSYNIYQERQGAIIGNFTQADLSIALNYFENSNELSFSITTVWTSGGNLPPSPKGLFTMLDSQGNTWDFRFDIPTDKDKFIKRCRQIICSSYYYDSRYSYKPSYYKTTVDENWIKSNIKSPLDGIYDNGTYKLAATPADGNNRFYLIYLGGKSGYRDWNVGDVKAILEPTATPGLYTAIWYGRWKQAMNYKIAFSNGFMTTYDENNDKDVYTKLFPSASLLPNDEPSSSWSGSGFALLNGYLVTNYHVVEDAKNIEIRGIKGDFNKALKAEVIATDTYNDLALLKIKDSNFNGFGTIPYSIKMKTAEVGEDVFVLGYPLTATMGDEVKLTTGVISSKTGFQGDVSTYQVSAPIQPGNSGEPLFDSKGNIIGIVSAKHKGAENVGYAIKTLYLQNLIESALSQNIIPSNNTISQQPLTGKVKAVKDFVYIISCSSASNNSPSSSPNLLSNAGVSVSYPSVRSTTAERARIKSVKVTDSYTAVEIIYNNASGSTYYSWCNIDKGTYIVANGTRYTMTRAEGIKIAPEKTDFSYAGQDITFTLYFPKIPSGISSIDLIESQDSEWKFYGISLK